MRAHSLSELGVSSTLDWFLKNESRKWMSQITCRNDKAIRISIAVVDLVLPEWQTHHPDDSVPVRAVDAARRCVSGDSVDLRQHLKVLSKGCSNSRHRSMGYCHRVAEAARAVANAASANTASAIMSAVSDALEKTEEHILYRYSVDAIYGKEGEVRRMMFEQIIQVLEEY